MYELLNELKYAPDELDESLRSSARSTFVVETLVGGRRGSVGRIVEANNASANGIRDPPEDFVGASIPQASLCALAHARTCGCLLMPNLLSAWIKRDRQFKRRDKLRTSPLTKMIATTDSN